MFKSLFVIAALLTPTVVFAQTYPLPANVTEGPAICTGCPGSNDEGEANDGKPTWQFDVPVAYHLGRYVDSSSTMTYSHDVLRTVRANAVRVDASRNRLYVALGELVGVYPLDTFFSHLVRKPVEPVSAIKGRSRRTANPVEKATMPVAYLDIEDADSGWMDGVGIADAGIILNDFDLDDRGYLYAASVYGWGINHDDGRTDRTQLPFVYKNTAVADRIFTLETGGAYYAVVSETSNMNARIYETTSPSAPAWVRTDARGFIAWAKHEPGEVVATIARDGGLRLHTFAAFVAGGAALAEYAPTTGRMLSDLAFDEDGRLWVAEKSKVPGGASVLWRVSLTGSGYEKTTFDVYPTGFAPAVIHAAGGWIAAGGDGRDAEANVAPEVHLFQVTDGVPARIDTGDFFRRYYFRAPVGYAQPVFAQLSDLRLLPIGGRTYLMNGAWGLGDVFELGAALRTQVEVTAMSPLSGPPAGGTTVGIAGANLGGNVSVTFGGVASGSVNVVSETWITAVTPSHAAGTVPVVVSVNSSPLEVPDQFTYELKTPATFSATATSPTSVQLSVQAVDGASGYEFFRRNPDGSWLSLGIGDTTFVDSTRTADSAHLYRARAVDAGGAFSDFSPMDLATTSSFTVFTPGSPIRATHINELRAAINVLRTSAGLAAHVFTETVEAGTTIRAQHISEMRTAVTEGRVAFGLPATNLGGDAVPGAQIFGAHLELIRDAFH